MNRSNLVTNVDALSKGYTTGRRIMDTCVIVLFFLLEAFIVYRAWPFILAHPWTSLLVAVTGYIAADFMSGLVHWIGDTWGDPSLPIVGQYFIRPFREHHVDETAITRHDFTETNGANSLATMVVLLPTVLLLSSLETSLVLGFHVFAFAMTMGVFGTNQFHKWSHLPETGRTRLIRWLQASGLVLRPAHHAKHHAAPFDTYYCITVGWLNPMLAKLKFFRVSEKIISRVTGAIPRKNDIVLTANKAITTVRALGGEVNGKLDEVIEGVKDGVSGVMEEVGETVKKSRPRSFKTGS